MGLRGYHENLSVFFSFSPSFTHDASYHEKKCKGKETVLLFVETASSRTFCTFFSDPECERKYQMMHINQENVLLEAVRMTQKVMK